MMQFCISFVEITYNVFMKFSMELAGEPLAEVKSATDMENVSQSAVKEQQKVEATLTSHKNYVQ